MTRSTGSRAPGARLAVFSCFLLIAGLFFALPSEAQALCEDDPDLPTCIEPDVQVELPERIDARWTSGIWDAGEALVTVPVNVTLTNDLAPPDEETTVTIEIEPIPGVSASSESTTITPGETVTIPVVLQLDVSVPAGDNLLRYHVNTTGTNVHAPTQQTKDSELLMAWWFIRIETEVPSIRFLDDSSEYRFRVNNMTANGPFDLLLTSPKHVPDPRILEIPPGLSPFDPVTHDWTVRFHGPTDYIQWEMWPVVSAEDQLYCLEAETGKLLPLERDTDEIGELSGLADACLLVGGSGGFSGTGGQIGGLAGLVFLISNGLVLFGMVGAILLGGFVLRRGGKKLPTRALGAYLLMAGIGFGLMSFHWILVELFGWVIANRIVPPFFWPIVGTAFIILPTAILFFALGYPTIHPRLRNMKHWYLLPFAPWLLFTPFIFVKFEDAAFIMSFTFIITGTIVAAVLFRQRAAQAATQLERERLLFMYRFVSLPLIAGAALVILVASLDTYVLDGAIWRTGLPGILIAPVALGPVLGMSWGLLRYKIVDLDTKLRLTINRGFIGAVFIAVFFLVAELVKTYFSENLGPYIGLVAAAMLIPALVPLQRIGNRLASRVVPEPPDPEAYQSFRRLEIYRAAYEEVAVDDQVTDKEHRAMDSLARSLKLSNDEVSFVETEVKKEREALPPSSRSPATSGV